MADSFNKLSDEDLIAIIHDGDKQAFGVVYTRYYDELLYFTSKLLNDKEKANGIISETFMKLWDRRINFPSVKNMRSFLHITCRNEALSVLRKIQTKRTVYTNEFPDRQYESEAEAQIIEAEILDQLYKELLHLSPQQKTIVELLIAGKGTKEICAELNITVKTLRNMKSSAVSRLRKELRSKNILHLLLILN